ncbi:hypothetical protein DSECCO2_161460 [anaerobic digester metagenome]
MKLLLDQNISFRIASRIQDIYPGTRQVKELGLENSKDLIIWEYARRNGFCILTFDNDFYDIGLLKRIAAQNNLAENRKYQNQ